MINLNIDPNQTLDDVFSAFDNGDIDGIDAYLYIKKLSTIIAGIKEHQDIKDDVFDEVAKYAKGEDCYRNGFVFSTASKTNYKYDFNYLIECKKKVKGLEDQSKALLKAGIPSAFIPDENGEQQEIKAAIPSVSSYVKVSTKK